MPACAIRQLESARYMPAGQPLYSLAHSRLPAQPNNRNLIRYIIGLLLMEIELRTFIYHFVMFFCKHYRLFFILTVTAQLSSARRGYDNYFVFSLTRRKVTGETKQLHRQISVSSSTHLELGDRRCCARSSRIDVGGVSLERDLKGSRRLRRALK